MHGATTTLFEGYITIVQTTQSLKLEDIIAKGSDENECKTDKKTIVQVYDTVTRRGGI